MEINECSVGAHNCQQQCINENGGFRCECFDGYILNADLATCSGMQWNCNSYQLIMDCGIFLIVLQILTNVLLTPVVVVKFVITLMGHSVASALMDTCCWRME